MFSLNNCRGVPTIRSLQVAWVAVVAFLFIACPSLHAAFGLTTTSSVYTVDTGAGLVFSVRRTDPAGSGQSAGDISSLIYNGVEYQYWAKGSQIETGLGAANVSAAAIGTDIIQITVEVPGVVTHYFVARKGYPHIYMATYTLPRWTVGEIRWICRLYGELLVRRPVDSDTDVTDHAIESSDVFGTTNGETRSKYYGNSRAKEMPIRGASRPGAGLYMIFNNRETSSGGPFFRDIQNQGVEIYNYLNSGHNQPDTSFRIGAHAPYALVFTDGSIPAKPDMSFMDGLGLGSYVPSEGRGNVAGGGITGRDTRFTYTAALTNRTGQYWADASADTGAFLISGVKPGKYTLTIYKNELSVYTGSVGVGAGSTSSLPTIAITGDPARNTAIWRIGDWDGTPREFLNGDRVTIMHPSDVRMSSWTPGPYVIGTSTPATGMPCYQWRAVNPNQTIQFTLTAGQLVASTVRLGITVAVANGRPAISVNSWNSGTPSISAQPDSRSLTIGTYRGNNTTFSYSVPASALVVGTNTLSFSPNSGSSGGGFLDAGYSIDCIELTQGSSTISPPSAPAGLTATPVGVNVSLSWPSVSGATSYQVQRSTESSGPYMPVAEVSTVTYSDTGAGSGKSYYQVKARNAAGAGIASPQATVTVAGTSVPRVMLAFDNDSGTTAADTSGNGQNGTLNGGATFGTGKTGGAVNLSGSAQFVSLPAGVVSACNDFTISAWVKVTAATNWARIFDFGSGPINSMSLIAQTDSSRLRFVMRTPSRDEQIIESSAALPVGTWTHVSVSVAGDVGTIYVNGIPAGTNPSFTLRPWQLGSITANYLGKPQTPADTALTVDPYFNGAIDDFRIDARGLAGAEVYALSGGASGNAPSFTAKPVVLSGVNQGTNYSTVSQTLTSSVSNPSGGALIFTKLSGPAWLTVASNGALSGTPGNTDIGINSFIVRVTNANGAVDTGEIRLTIGNVNDAPVWFANPFTREPITVGQIYTGSSLANSASDGDIVSGDTIAFTKVSGPSWLSIASNGTLSGTPAAGNIGTNTFVARVTDGTGLSSDATFTIAVTSPSLQIRHAFDGNATDSQGGPAAVITGTASYGPGVISQAVVLNGSTNYVTLGALPDTLYKDFSATAWINRTVAADNQRIFDFGSGTRDYMALTLVGSTLRFQIAENGVTQTLNATAPALGTWAHVAVTLTGNTATIYVNGAAAASGTITNEPSNLGLIYNYLGKSQFFADPLFNGQIDDFRLYNYGLSASEVVALISNGPPLTPTEVSALAVGSKVTVSWTLSDSPQTYNVKRGTTSGTYTLLASGLTAASYTDTTAVPGATYYYIVSASNGQGESANSAEVSAFVSGLLVHLKFDETSGTAAEDSSGNGSNATMATTGLWSAGYYANAINLTGASNQYATLPAGVVNGVTDCTISCWVKIGAFSTYSRIFDLGTGTTNYMFLTPQYTTGGNAAKMRLAIRSTTVAEQQINSSTALPIGTWAHVAFTLSGSTGTLYLNGMQVGQNTGMTLNPASLGSTTLNYIGKSRFSADPYLNSSVDDFRIYGRALGAGEITALGLPAAGASGLSATAHDASVSLTWTTNATTSYTLRRATASGGPYSIIAEGVTSLSYSDIAVSNENTYYYVISGSNASGPGPDSAEVVAKPSTLRVHIKFNETAGTIAADSSGNRMDATLVNNPEWSDDGKIDNALSLASASSQYATLPPGVVGDITTATIMCWVKTSSVVSWQRVFDFGTGTTNYMFLATQYATGGNAGKPRFAIRIPGVAEQQINSAVAMPAGQWTHVAVVLNGSVGTLYINGTQVGQNNAMTLNLSSLGATTANYIGKSQFGTDPYLDASIDDFSLHSRAMSGSEITLYANPLAAPQNVDATSQPESIGLTWTASPNASSYTVKYAPVSGGPYIILASGLTATSYTHTGLTYGTSNYYVVTASNPAWLSADSLEAAATAGSTLISNAEFEVAFLRNDGASGNFTVKHSIVGHGYQLQRSLDLSSGSWIDVGPVNPGSGGELDIPLILDPTKPRCFFRVLISR